MPRSGSLDLWVFSCSFSLVWLYLSWLACSNLSLVYMHGPDVFTEGLPEIGAPGDAMFWFLTSTASTLVLWVGGLILGRTLIKRL